MRTWAKEFLIGLAVATTASLLSNGILGFALGKTRDWLQSLVSPGRGGVLVLAALLVLSGLVLALRERVFLGRSLRVAWAILCLAGAAVIGFVLVSYLSYETKKAVEITALVAALSVGLVFYDPEKLPSWSDRITYFLGVTLGPVGLVNALL